VTAQVLTLVATSVAIGFVHTVLGPDHYVPFVAMAKARHWSNRRTLIITLLSGIGHVTSSVIIGLVGLLFGVEVLKLAALESARGAIAGWLLFGFGLAYTVWGIRYAVKHSPLTHSHDGLTHVHLGHKGHHHESVNITPWVLFTIFVFGPCEPLIPLVMYSATAGALTVTAVALAFSVTCVATMTVLVMASVKGLNLLPHVNLNRYMHALAGSLITLCGAGVLFLRL
jgi:nickel/cobalt transporter (NicO) family protein